MKLLFIIGMQKSGTSLLNRILIKQDFICNPFLPEGKFFWGDNPPFTPTEKPCGELYQSYGGSHGHSLNENDYRYKDQSLLLDRIKHAAIEEPILMNKNPYNSVRITWLKKIFPECKIITVVRNPISNIYSLLKKYHPKNTTENQGNEWWGIKPKNWQELQSKNKTLQCSKQWYEVNKHILDNRQNIDHFINYEDLCDHPNIILKNILELFKKPYAISEIPQCKNFNNEYLTGSRIESKNKEFRTTKEFDLSSLKETIEFPPLTEQQITLINSNCQVLWSKITKLIST